MEPMAWRAAGVSGNVAESRGAKSRAFGLGSTSRCFRGDAPPINANA